MMSSIQVDGRADLPTLASTWKPFGFLDVTVRTTLTPCGTDQAGWHVRIHRVRWSGVPRGISSLLLVDGAFAVSSCGPNGLFIPQSEDFESINEYGWFMGSTSRECQGQGEEGGKEEKDEVAMVVC